MKRRFEITVDGERVRAMAELVDGAPWTTGNLWRVLTRAPIVGQVFHSKWAGREVALFPPEQCQFDISDIRPENAVRLPIPGDICFWYFPPGAGAMVYPVPHPSGDYKGVWNIQMVYGRETEFRVSGGVETRNLWARVVDNLDDFADVCARTQFEGAKTFRFTAIRA